MSTDRNEFLNDINSFISESKSYLNDLLNELNWSDEKTCRRTRGDSDGRKSHDISDTLVSTVRNETEISARTDCQMDKDILSNLTEFQLPVKKVEEISLFELLAKERDLKRRRISYKGRVHTKHKSHYEIMRDVIGQQMELLEDCASLQMLPDSSDVSKDITCETQLIDLSQLYVKNPHLTWKYIKVEVDSMSSSEVGSSVKQRREIKRLSEKTSRYDESLKKREKRDKSSDKVNKRSIKRKHKSYHSDKNTELSNDEIKLVKKDNMTHKGDNNDLFRNGAIHNSVNDNLSSRKVEKCNSDETKSDNDLCSTDDDNGRLYCSNSYPDDTGESKRRRDQSEHPHKKKSKKRKRHDRVDRDESRSKKHYKSGKSHDRKKRDRYENT